MDRQAPHPLILFHHVEAWAMRFSGVEVGVGYDQGLGKTAVQILQEMKERVALCRRARILGRTVRPQAPDVAHSNRVLVVIAAVSTHLLNRSSTFHAAVGRDDKMIPAAFPTERAVIGIDIVSAKRRPFTVGGTMNDDQRDVAHEREGD